MPMTRDRKISTIMSKQRGRAAKAARVRSLVNDGAARQMHGAHGGFGDGNQNCEVRFVMDDATSSAKPI